MPPPRPAITKPETVCPMAFKRHSFKLTEQIIRQIEYVLPRLKYSVYIQQVIAWLENFEEDEVTLALDYLFYLEYIPFSELQARLNSQLVTLDKWFGKKFSYLLLPFAEYPKSNDIVLYLLAKCPAYTDLKREGRISIERDIKNVKVETDTMLVFVDDFIGSGKSFEKWYRKSNITSLVGSTTKILEDQAILSAIIMEGGNQFITHKFPEIKVFADFRHKIFCKTNSPFNLLGNRAEMQRLCLKYGLQIITGFRWPHTKLYTPLGFDKSEALVAFDYNTPNNTLSIIWGDNKWTPIFPRQAKSRMKKSSQIKNEAAFYLGLMHRMGINFESDVEMIVGEQHIRLSARDDHSILVYLVLLNKHYSSIQICQVLGITTSELSKIISKAGKKKLVNKQGVFTRRGIDFLARLKSVANVFTFRENDDLKVRDEKIFVPKSFRNMS
jgi:hypothetical protein